MSSIPPPVGDPVAPAARPTPARWSRWLVGASISVLALVLGWFVPMDTYAITPGSATAMADLVTAKPLQGTAPPPPARGSAYMADVYVTSLNLDRWLYSHAFDRNADYASSQQILGPGGDEQQLTAQGYVEMSDSNDAARVAAFDQLGLEVEAKPVGARVDAVSSSGAAHGKLSAGDRVIAVEGASVTGACGLIRATHDLSPGTSMQLTVERAEFSPVGALSYAKATTVQVRVGRPHPSAAASGCRGVDGPARGALGISVTTALSYRWPIDVSVRTELVGGPSAGLAMTLQILDELTGGQVLHGRRVASTGTMSIDGQVGDVGGVRQKAVAVGQAGVSLFLVPKGERATAEAGAPSGLRIAEVSTLAQALRELKASSPLALSPAWARAVA